MNILILSCGIRNKIIQYFKEELNGKGKVLAADCSKLAPALYEADEYFIVPRIDEEGYLDIILEICKENCVDGIISLIDPELSQLAKNKQAFLDIGVTPIISDYSIVDMCYDKYKFYKFLVHNGIKTLRTYTNKQDFYRDISNGYINYPVVIKPRMGSASIGLNIVTKDEELEILFKKQDNLIIQEYANGIEYGADVYIDMISGDMATIFTKQKIRMRAGETDKSVSTKDEKLFNIIKEFVEMVGFRGVIDIDIFKIDGEYYISEVNPRFGGGYPHAHECGVNIPRMIINNISGKANESIVGQYEENVYMMKFNDIRIIKM